MTRNGAFFWWVWMGCSSEKVNARRANRRRYLDVSILLALQQVIHSAYAIPAIAVSFEINGVFSIWSGVAMFPRKQVFQKHAFLPASVNFDSAGFFMEV